MKKTGLNGLSILLAVFILFGILMMLYPVIAESIYQSSASSVIAECNAEISSDSEEEIMQMKSEAVSYNTELSAHHVRLQDPFTEDDEYTSHNYEEILNLSHDTDGFMGSITIPAISVELPVYHYSSQTILQKGIGHLHGSSLPVGGEGSHCVLTGHNGLSSARMFTDLEELKNGDMIYLHVLNETLAYTVIDMKVVEPDDVSDLRIEDGEDLLTLITCTPYGINTHRLLVTGRRTAYSEDTMHAERSSGKTASKWFHEYVISLLSGGSLIVFLPSAYAMILKMKKRKEDCDETMELSVEEIYAIEHEM